MVYQNVVLEGGHFPVGHICWASFWWGIICVELAARGDAGWLVSLPYLGSAGNSCISSLIDLVPLTSRLSSPIPLGLESDMWYFFPPRLFSSLHCTLFSGCSCNSTPHIATFLVFWYFIFLV